MKKFALGVDLSASQNVYTLAEYETGVIVYQERVDEGAFYRPPNSPDTAPRTLDTDPRVSNLPPQDRLHTYLGLEVIKFLAERDVSREDVVAVGISLAGRTFNSGRDGQDVTFLGGNTPERFGEEIGGGQIAINVTRTLRRLFLDIPIVGGNDCNAIGKAQSFVYAREGKDPRKTFYITISTGIGGGGPVDDVDEVGHMQVANVHPAVALECGCHMMNCLEAYASGSGIAKFTERVIRLKRTDPYRFSNFAEYERQGGRVDGSLQDIVEGSQLNVMFDRRRQVTSKEVCAAMRGGDKLALYILDTTARMTAQVIVDVAQIHGVDTFGIGGGVGENNPDYVAMIQQHVNNIAPPGKNKLLPNGVRVEVTPLGTVSNYYGALSLIVPREYVSTWADTMVNVSLERRRQKTCG